MLNLKRVMTREFLADALEFSAAVVMFEKKNGDTRLMLCTTDENAVPDDDVPSTWPINGGGDLFTVYDLEKNAWRRFLYSKVSFVSV